MGPQEDEDDPLSAPPPPVRLMQGPGKGKKGPADPAEPVASQWNGDPAPDERSSSSPGPAHRDPSADGHDASPRAVSSFAALFPGGVASRPAPPPRARAAATRAPDEGRASVRTEPRPAPLRAPAPFASPGDAPATWLRRFLRRFRPPRRLKFTREGKYYMGITLGVGFAAINTGNNLLYLLLGMLLSLMLVSGVMSELSLNKLTVTRRLPARAQVGRPHLVEIEVYNHKKRVPSYAIEVEDLRAGQPADKRCFFLKISPSSAQVAAYRRTPARRGRDRHTGFRIATRFPFGLFEKSREVHAEDELVIYPAVDPVRLPPEEAGRRDGGSGANGRGGGDETYSLRHKREGDDPRDIYWRKSTMMGQLILRERARETRPDVHLGLDVVRPTGADDAFAPHFEKRIRDLASRAVAHIKRGDTVVVTTTVGERTRGDGTFGSDPILRFLALLDAVDEAWVTRLRAERAAAGRAPAHDPGAVARSRGAQGSPPAAGRTANGAEGGRKPA